jgi:hypothetical protein
MLAVVRSSVAAALTCTNAALNKHEAIMVGNSLAGIFNAVCNDMMYPVDVVKKLSA